jgi:hypothetical protein
MKHKNSTCPKCDAVISSINSGVSLYPFAFRCSTCNEKLRYKNIFSSFILMLLIYALAYIIEVKMIDTYLQNNDLYIFISLGTIIGTWILSFSLWLSYIKIKKEIVCR